MKLTVITVCYQAEAVIRPTIESVLSQDGIEMEYRMIDGASKDRTVAIAEEYRPAFEKKGIPFFITSEPDKGIYDAMNKGIRQAEGEFLSFMNAGDRFFSPHSAREALQGAQDADVVYGYAILALSGHYKKHFPDPLETLNEHMAFNHQSSFVRRTQAQKLMFRTEYRLGADYDMMLRLYREGGRFCYVPVPVAVYDMAGVSETNAFSTQEETLRVRHANGIPPKPEEQQDQKKIMRFVRRREAARKLLPFWYFSRKRGWYPTPEEADKGS